LTYLLVLVIILNNVEYYIFCLMEFLCIKTFMKIG